MKSTDIKPGQEYAFAYTTLQAVLKYGGQDRVRAVEKRSGDLWTVEYIDTGVQRVVRSRRILLPWEEFSAKREAVLQQQELDRQTRRAEFLKQNQAAVRLEQMLRERGLNHDFVRSTNMALDAADLEHLLLVFAGTR